MQNSALNTVHASAAYAITVVTFLAVENADIRKITRQTGKRAGRHATMERLSRLVVAQVSFVRQRGIVIAAETINEPMANA